MVTILDLLKLMFCFLTEVYKLITIKPPFPIGSMYGLCAYVLLIVYAKCR